MTRLIFSKTNACASFMERSCDGVCHIPLVVAPLFTVEPDTDRQSEFLGACPQRGALMVSSCCA